VHIHLSPIGSQDGTAQDLDGAQAPSAWG
jgi:hypothetical protein